MDLKLKWNSLKCSIKSKEREKRTEEEEEKKIMMKGKQMDTKIQIKYLQKEKSSTIQQNISFNLGILFADNLFKIKL